MSINASCRRSTAAQPAPQRRIPLRLVLEVSDAEGDVPGLVRPRQPGDLTGDGVGGVFVEEGQ
ncbi:hypothetical protein [Pseudonocardia terrae]|uniref:hypothetical protein n=1 Tax=Pseudonocardia terrae TaxID=2905831 RepID=UPI001E36E3B8|nr:hypothetical protein [Pseudonocardia terrae]